MWGFVIDVVDRVEEVLDDFAQIADAGCLSLLWSTGYLCMYAILSAHVKM